MEGRQTAKDRTKAIRQLSEDVSVKRERLTDGCDLKAMKVK